MDGRELVALIALASTGAGALAWWRWRRRVTAAADDQADIGRQMLELLRSILAELRRR